MADEYWECENCGEEFTLKSDCAKHEKKCKQANKQSYKNETNYINKKTFLISLTIFIVLTIIIVGAKMFNSGTLTMDPQQDCWDMCHTIGNEACFYDHYWCYWMYYPDRLFHPQEFIFMSKLMISPKEVSRDISDFIFYGI